MGFGGMKVATISKEILDAASSLAAAHLESEPQTTEVFLVPVDDRVLLVEVDPEDIGNEESGPVPVYFRAYPNKGIPFPSGIVTVTPEEKDSRIPLPEGWGSWDDLILIWPEADFQ